jgi:hypothetical protein
MIKFAICSETEKCDREQATAPPFFRAGGVEISVKLLLSVP